MSVTPNKSSSSCELRQGIRLNSTHTACLCDSTCDKICSTAINGPSYVSNEHRSSLRSTSSTISRSILPYVTHFSDSGFSSNLSSGSSCSFLPPPPPYRMRGTGKTHRIHRSFSDSKYGCSNIRVRPSLPGGSVNFLQEQCRVQNSGNWISRSPSPSMSTVSCPEYPEQQEKLHRLAMARDSLSLQVTVLTEQVGAQKEKIRDLEQMLASKRNKLDSTEELLHDHADNRHDLESRKLDLMAEVSNLKLRYATLEREKFETERKLRLSQAEIEHLNQSMQGFMLQHGLLPQFQNFHVNPYSFVQTIVNDSTRASNDPTSEMEQLRMAVQRLIADNEQKNIQINTLRNALDEHYRYERELSSSFIQSLPVQKGGNIFGGENQVAFDINAQIRKLLMEDYNDRIAHSSSFPTNLHNAQQHHSTSTPSRTTSAIQSSSSYTSSLSATSPQHSWSNSGTPRHHAQYGGGLLSTNLPPVSSSPSASLTNYRSPSSPAARQLAAELDELRRIGGEIQQKHDLSLDNGNVLHPLKSAKAMSTLTLPRKKLSANLSTGISVESDDEVMRGRPSRMTSDKFRRDRTRSSLRNLLGKLTRSTSQEIRSSEFRRNSATRSSTSARLASVGPLSGAVALRPTLQQFVDWTTEQVCEWMAEIGFSLYVPEVERFVRSGRHLLNMTNQEFDKEFVMKNSLHRKRLRCTLNTINRGTIEPCECMDVHQVLRWLDDIGLPQYRDNFAENLIDGQMLIVLTAQDLMEMKISSALHHATISRGIQFLRSIDFRTNRIERKFDPDVIRNNPCPNIVERWSHQCVCQWLKAIDLAEFTPNMLCAGIHGALMVHESTFTAESLAEVLQIPGHKTLLRRHLATHFNQLLGQDIISHKRTILAQPFVAQLTPSLKIRLLKRGFSLSRKKGKNEVYVEPDELVCPPNNSKTKFPQSVSENILDSLASSNV